MPLSWSDAEVTAGYHNGKLEAALKSDPVINVLEIRLMGQFAGPVPPCLFFG